MFTRGKIFLAGLILFFCGFIVPLIIGVAIGAWGTGDNTRYHVLYNSFTVGVIMALCVGLPLIVISIFMRKEKRGTERTDA